MMSPVECIRCRGSIGRDENGLFNGEMTENGEGWVCDDCLEREEETATRS